MNVLCCLISYAFYPYAVGVAAAAAGDYDVGDDGCPVLGNFEHVPLF